MNKEMMQLLYIKMTDNDNKSVLYYKNDFLIYSSFALRTEHEEKNILQVKIVIIKKIVS